MTISNKQQLISLHHQSELDYVYFWGGPQKQPGVADKSCLSQWFKSSFVIGNERYFTAEHYMMAEKARFFGDIESLKAILKVRDPSKAKSIGRKVKGYDDEAWKARRFEAVVEGNRYKFGQNDLLKRYLLSTGDTVLVEASPVDLIWGIGMAEADARIKQPELWPGQNLLGFALMQVRAEFQERL